MPTPSAKSWPAPSVAAWCRSPRPRTGPETPFPHRLSLPLRLQQTQCCRFHRQSAKLSRPILISMHHWNRRSLRLPPLRSAPPKPKAVASGNFTARLAGNRRRCRVRCSWRDLRPLAQRLKGCRRTGAGRRCTGGANNAHNTGRRRISEQAKLEPPARSNRQASNPNQRPQFSQGSRRNPRKRHRPK